MMANIVGVSVKAGASTLDVHIGKYARVCTQTVSAKFTWSRHCQQKSPLFKKLDWILATTIGYLMNLLKLLRFLLDLTWIITPCCFVVGVSNMVNVKLFKF